MSDDEIHEKHESYAMVSFSRRTGDPGVLFGSPLHHHHSYIALTIRRAERIHNLGHDRFYGSMRGDLIEVDLSPAQFAELLTTMNVGMGVPCTLRYLDGKQMEKPPTVEMETEKVQTSFEKDTKKLVHSLEQKQHQIDEILEKKALSKDDRAKIRSLLDTAIREVGSNMPFMLERFSEATEKVTTHAKAEVDAFITHNVILEGIRAIQERNQVPQLPPAEGEVSHVEHCDCNECRERLAE